MERLERLAYSKGYYAGCQGRWPSHRPPSPPDPIHRHLVDALKRLANAVDAELAMLDGDDQWQTSLGNPLDEANAALEELGHYLTTADSTHSEA